MRDLFLTHEVPQGVLQLRLLNEKIVFRLQGGTELSRPDAPDVRRKPAY